MGIANKGNKHTCSSCGARFYDLLRPTATCPKCGTVDQTETGRLAALAALKAEAEAESVNTSTEHEDVEDDLLDLDLELEEDEDDEGDDEDSLMEDTSDLSHVEDDVVEVFDHIESPGPVDL